MSYYDRYMKKGPTVYLTPAALLKAGCEYFDWCVKHPLKEAKTYQWQGNIIRAKEDKVRAFTWKGLASHLGITVAQLNRHRLSGDKWAETIELLEQIIYTQKFENAAAGLLNATIISRDLGLAEKSEVSGTAGAPPISFTITPIATGTFIPEVAV